MDSAEYYEIRVENYLPRDLRAYWFDGLTAREEAAGTTVLSGPVADQAALHGILRRLHDLNMKLVLVRRVQPGQLPGSEAGAPSQA